SHRYSPCCGTPLPVQPDPTGLCKLGWAYLLVAAEGVDPGACLPVLHAAGRIRPALSGSPDRAITRGVQPGHAGRRTGAVYRTFSGASAADFHRSERGEPLRSE